ncbi:hypothetical protein LWI29_034131 [Acer saccharum]|uniref:Uncharacterized protein n=1 Tax=Acer saccharum TaxID=4024 RepID=A0AA39SFU2_ACESA|nr:hypothetical protein LWI29_034131 [Acer saccharum]
MSPQVSPWQHKIFAYEVIPTLATRFASVRQLEQPFPRILKWNLTNRPRRDKLEKIFTIKVAPDYLEHRFADVISAVEALREEVRKSERDRKESDKVRDEQHKELVRMIQTLQGTSTQMYTDDPFHYEAPRVMPQQGLGRQTNSVQTSHEDIAALHRRDSVPPPQQGSVPHPHQDSVPHPHQDSVEASHEDTAALPRRDLVPPPQQDNVAVHDTETFDQGIAELPRKDAVLPPSKTLLRVVEGGYQVTVSWFEELETNHAELEDTAHMYRLWVGMFSDVEAPPDDQKWSVLTRT